MRVCPLPEALKTAAAAAFSQDSLLVPTSSMTLYTLSATLPSCAVGFVRRVTC